MGRIDVCSIWIASGRGMVDENLSPLCVIVSRASFARIYLWLTSVESGKWCTVLCICLRLYLLPRCLYVFSIFRVIGSEEIWRRLVRVSSGRLDEIVDLVG